MDEQKQDDKPKTQPQPEPEPPLDTLTPAERRVRIAKDVLEQIKAQRLFARRGLYVRLLEPEAKKALDAGMGQEAQPLLAGKQCDVCAIGSVLIAYIDRYDRAKVPDDPNGYFAGTDRGVAGLMDRDYAVEVMGGTFTEHQLIVMEEDFEERTASMGPGEALEAIMQRLIDSEGQYETYQFDETWDDDESCDYGADEDEDEA